MKDTATLKILSSALGMIVLASCSKEATEPKVEAQETLNLLNRDDAIEFILGKVDLTDDEAVQVRLLQDMITPSSFVDETNASDRRFANNYEWFAVIDRKPGAFVNHPFDYVYLNYETQDVIIREHHDYPMLNGEPIWKTSDEYFASPDLVYSSKGEETSAEQMVFKGGGSESVAPGLHEFFSKKPTDVVDNCEYSKRRYALLLYNQEVGIAGEDIRANLESMKTALQLKGYEVVYFPKETGSDELVYTIDIGGGGGRGLYNLRHFVNKHKDDKDCCEEILIYYTGSVGLEQARYGPQCYIETEFNYGGETSSRKPQKRIYSEDLLSIFEALKSCHLNIVIDSNHAAGLASDLVKMSNVEALVASTQLGEYAYSGIYEAAANGAVQDPYGRDDGETGSEFTSGFAKGLIDYGSLGVSEPLPISAYEVTAIGFKSALQNDISYLAGVTHPFGYVRSGSSHCKCSVE